MPNILGVDVALLAGLTTAERDALVLQDRLLLWNINTNQWEIRLSGVWRPIAVLDVNGNLSAAQHGTLVSGDLHPEYARVAAPENITAGWVLRSGGSLRATPGDPPVGEVAVQVKTTTGAPSHSATEGTPCWVAPDDDLYVNNDGSTGWTKQAKDSSLHVAFVQADADALYALLSHTLGTAHAADTLANLNAKVSDATLDDSGDSRPPSGTAGGDLGGTYPNPTMDARKASKSYLFGFPDEDMAVGDFISESAVRIPAAGKHGDITWGTVYARCVTVGTGTNTILFRTSTTLTGTRTTRATINLGTAREASGAITLTESDGMYLWVECSAVGATAPKKVIVQVDAEETIY